TILGHATDIIGIVRLLSLMNQNIPKKLIYSAEESTHLPVLSQIDGGKKQAVMPFWQQELE
ncbi:MAG: hypothetical protein KUF72_07985, partial [Candidatus Thiodiazotropha sp. (ex Ctena orbiculata)]|nr:hypothetical protein [Candidatus Thiodiazotropha taylori]